MRVSPTKASWFVIARCALAVLPVACRRAPAGSEATLCANDGVVSSRRDTNPDGREMAAEIVADSCQDCAHDVRAGALPGSPCSAASVCAEFCCDCAAASAQTRYRARLCASGQCADRQTACKTARSLIRPDICPSL